MLNTYQKYLDDLNIWITGALTLVAYAAVYGLFSFSESDFASLEPFQSYLFPVIIVASFVMFSMAMRKFSASKSVMLHRLIIRENFVNFTIGFASFSFLAYIIKIPHLSRLYMMSGVVLASSLSCLWHIAWMRSFKTIRAHHHMSKNVVLIGSPHGIESLIDLILKDKTLGLNIVGILSLDGSKKIRGLDYKYLGSVDEIHEIQETTPIDCAIVAGYRHEPELVEKAILECSDRGIEVWLKADFLNQSMAKSRVDYYAGIPLMVLQMGPKFGMSLLIKRVFDIVAAGSLLTVLAIPMLCVGFLVRMTSRGPALFKQKRMTLNGRRFVMYKFRSMRTDISKATLKNEISGPAFKMENDPRVTPLGHYLRKYSIDELPQLINVLFGDMSMIGPRPPLPSEVKLYQGWHRRRLSMRPGITGLWQVKSRAREKDFDEWVKLDLMYIDEWNLLLDLQIAFLTIPAIVKGTGS